MYELKSMSSLVFIGLLCKEDTKEETPKEDISPPKGTKEDQ